LSLSLTGLYADDSYSKSLLGLTEADDLQLAADLSWRVGEFTSIYLNAGYENIEAKQAGSESFASADWRAGNVDEFNTVGLGFNMRQIGEKFALQMDYTRSEGTSDINIDSQRGAADALPTIESTIDYFRLRLDYRHSARLRLSALLRYQSIVASDWALAGVAPATIPDVLTLGVKPYDEDLFLFGIGFALGFDAAHGTTSE
jgi:hypothetical protein